MSHQVVKVKRETVAPCMTCPLCHKLIRDATTIIECLHTFCRKCIYKKLSDEEWESCPICDIDLGCVPLEKLRPDHNLQDIRGKIFPSKRIKMKAPEIVTPVVLPVKRKERSLSSLVVSTPRVSTHIGMTGRRSKSTARKASKGSNFTIEKPVTNTTEDPHETPSLPEMLNKFTQKNSASGEPSNHPSLDKGRETRSDLWRPLNCLVEAASRSKSSKSPLVKSDDHHSNENEGSSQRKIKNKEHLKKSNAKDEKNSGDHALVEPERPKKSRKDRNKGRNPGELKVPPQAVVEAESAKYEIMNHPIWFSLVASDEVEGVGERLHQISPNYLRIKDGNMLVSCVQKYLKTKLNLASTTEVDIQCMGQTVHSTLTMKNLIDLWLQSNNGEKITARIGSSAKDFVMCIKFKTDQALDAKKMEKLDKIFFTLMARGPEVDISEVGAKEQIEAKPAKKGRGRKQ